MSSLKELVEGFEEVTYPRVVRNVASYRQTDTFIEDEVRRYLDMYRNLDRVDQTARLIRDMLDLLLRRYHGYSIEGNIGSHYRQKGVTAEVCDFEHVIPQARVRDMLIQGRITIRQAMNPPTCLIHKDLHRELKDAGLASKTPSVWHFWRRYSQVFDAEFETHNGQPVDTNTWDLGKHYEHFGVT